MPHYTPGTVGHSISGALVASIPGDCSARYRSITRLKLQNQTCKWYSSQIIIVTLSLIMIEPTMLIIPIMCFSLILGAVLIGAFRLSPTRYESLSRNSPIDGLRGLLAISVMTHHFYVTYMWKTTGEWFAPKQYALDNLGAIAVSLFFMITGYLFLKKMKKNEISWINLYKGRIFRIYPLYLFVGAVVFSLAVIESGYSKIGLYALIRSFVNWAMFTNSFLGSSSTNLMISGVNWTLLYEWGFYLSLPIIYSISKWNVRCKLAILLTAPILAYVLSETKPLFYALFALSAASTLEMRSVKKLIMRFKFISGLFLLSLISFTLFFTPAYSAQQMILVLLVFIIVVNGGDIFGLFHLKGMKILGDISYSIYLLHGLTLYLVFSVFDVFDFSRGFEAYCAYYPLILAITIAASMLTYNYVEQPSIRLGRIILSSKALAFNDRQ